LSILHRNEEPTVERRKAFATAGAVSITAVAVVVALGANMGLFGLTRHDDGPGQFKLVDNTAQSRPVVRTEVVDVPVPVPSEPSTASSPRSKAPTAGTGTSATASSAGEVAPSAPRSDDDGGDEVYEPGDHEDD
jgi:hypothetical protein